MAIGTVILRDRDARIASGLTSADGSRVVLEIQLSRGTHRLRARYAGTETFLPSWSDVVVVRR